VWTGTTRALPQGATSMAARALCRPHAPKVEERGKKIEKNVDETFRKNVECNVLSKNVDTNLPRKMLVEKSWFNIFVEKCFNIF
jgi:hypothetical protein